MQNTSTKRYIETASTDWRNPATRTIPTNNCAPGSLIKKPDPALPPKFDVASVQVSATNYDELVQVLIRCAEEKQSIIVDFTCADVIVRARVDPCFRRILSQFDILCPDGQPVRWLMNSVHHLKLVDRVCGTTAMLRLCAAAAETGIGIYLYGSTNATLRELQKQLRGLYPALQIVGLEAPPFRPLSEIEDRAVVERVNSSAAGLLFIGLGAGKQEQFAWEHRHRINAVQLCVGAAFDFVAGTRPRAPLVMQRSGLEWLFRLCCEPRRLARRYIIGNVRFALAALRQICTRQSQAQPDESGHHEAQESLSGN
jgi:exopolysaccharide biosynthesis WecB/TagA/CpsF family protein